MWWVVGGGAAASGESPVFVSLNESVEIIGNSNNKKTTHHAESFARCNLKTDLYKSFFYKTFRSHIHAKQVYLQNPKTLNPRNIPAVV